MCKARAGNFFTVMKTEIINSWGRVQPTPQQVVPMHDRTALLAAVLNEADEAARSSGAHATPKVLPFGNGRSYGDSNLNRGGILLDMRPLDRIIEFDARTGVLTCEAGVLLSAILHRFVPLGWFPAVTPGTQFITVGGAIANDVHGKNHHRAGSFGNHVVRFELLRSDGRRIVCAPQENPDWFAATIGGLGLTGVITWVMLQLRPVASPYLDCETIRFRSLDEFFDLSAASEAEYEHSVSWIDCAFAGKRLGRGLFTRGNHAGADLSPSLAPVAERARSERLWRVPFSPPFSLVNSFTLKAFNSAYFHRQRGDRARMLQHYRPFFYPLDTLLEWNRIYGPRGFYQYQCVIPNQHARRGVRSLLEAIAASGMGSILAVLKQFGAPRSCGMLSFPMPGTTLALDFPNRGLRLHQLFEELDRVVLESGGRLYPAKDGRMGPEAFKSGYQRWREFVGYVDPRFSSDFWRRVMAK
jgi:FAD/FMN-containing dehydrogenase